MIVVDTNILSYFFLDTVYSEKAVTLFRQESIWYAPYLWKNEFRNVLSLYLRKGLITIEDAFFIMEKAELLMEGNEFYITSRHILTLVNESNCSAYDCEFVALAQQLNVKLITEDKKIISEFKDIAVNLDTFLS
ncbi:MAG: type II toxin-antitoxin system VapC family toxin [Spirochaetales bacterium]|nr:type II toxin-antitoxin system VapC family toxin [Spirochaetales bacterium]